MIEQLKPLVKRIIDISYEMKLSHIGSCLTALPIIAEIYEKKKPDEKFILSAGHAHLAHLVTMEKYISNYIDTYTQHAIEKYGIHCDLNAGCDVSTGSLGHGIGIAVGMALADRSKNVYCLLSDGECAEGSVWEAMRIRYELGLANLKVYVNCNGWSAYQEVGLPQWPDKFDYEARFNYSIPFPFLKGQDAHYKVLTREDYDEALKILA